MDARENSLVFFISSTQEGTQHNGDMLGMVMIGAH